MIKIGLTGGIGSGKSTVSSFLKEIGIKVIDADVIAREVIDVYDEVLINIRNVFGEEVINNEGKLNRKKLGSIVFKDENNKKKLESIIIPFIKKEIFDRIYICRETGAKICVLDAPTLIENDLHLHMDYNILVWVDKETQIKRVMMRDEISREEVILRINAQMSVDEKKKYVQFIIDNSKSIENTIEQVKSIFTKIDEMEKSNEKKSF